jgi:hypothetical protein
VLDAGVLARGEVTFYPVYLLTRDRKTSVVETGT